MLQYLIVNGKKLPWYADEAVYKEQLYKAWMALTSRSVCNIKARRNQRCTELGLHVIL